MTSAGQTGLYTPDRIRRHGELEHFRTPSGVRVILLPTRTVPHEQLIPDNWEHQSKVPVGNRRIVYNVTRLIDGTKVDLYAKQPERYFTADRKRLKTSDPWWGGAKSGEKSLFIRNHPLVERLAAYEAMILMHWIRSGYAGEIPQAILFHPTGVRELVVAGARRSTDRFQLRHLSVNEVPEAARTIGLTPHDASQFNTNQDEEGRNNVIDVSRWEWPRFTDAYRRRLVALIDRELKKHGS